MGAAGRLYGQRATHLLRGLFSHKMNARSRELEKKAKRNKAEEVARREWATKGTILGYQSAISKFYVNSKNTPLIKTIQGVLAFYETTFWRWLPGDVQQVIKQFMYISLPFLARVESIEVHPDGSLVRKIEGEGPGKYRYYNLC